jgi:hypothetical protein
MPSGCHEVQRWSFLIEEDDTFPVIAATESLDENGEDPPSRFCVLNSVTFRTDGGEKSYKEHLSAV